MKESRIVAVELVGNALRLRPLRAGDAVPAAGYLADPELLRQIVWEPPSDLAELASEFAIWTRPHPDGDSFRFAVQAREGGKFLGAISLRFAGHPGVGELGYWLGKPFWGRGHMSEAVGLVSYFAFQVLKAPSLCAWVHEGNEASRRVLERNGFSLVQTVPARAISRARGVRNDWYLAFLRSEWQRLEEKVQPHSVEVCRAD